METIRSVSIETDDDGGQRHDDHTAVGRVSTEQIFGELAAVELRHAAHWADKLTELGKPVNYSSVGRPRCWSSESDT